MGLVIRSPKDLWLGIIYALAGTAGIGIGQDLSFGSGARMGPGYFPIIISIVLLLFGLLSIGRAFALTGSLPSTIAWKRIVFIIGAVLIFATLIDGAGFVLAALALLFFSAMGSDLFRFSLYAAVGALALVTLCALLFIEGLGLPVPAVGPWLKLTMSLLSNR